jgi:stress-induced morphogen
MISSDSVDPIGKVSQQAPCTDPKATAAMLMQGVMNGHPVLVSYDSGQGDDSDKYSAMANVMATVQSAGMSRPVFYDDAAAQRSKTNGDGGNSVVDAAQSEIVRQAAVTPKPNRVSARAHIKVEEAQYSDGDSSPKSKYEAKFRCEICGKVFNQSGNLNRHKVVHTRSRPFKCDVCGKGFSQKSHVRTHQTVHTGTKAFECHNCQKRFSQLGHLNGHLDRHRRLEDMGDIGNDPNEVEVPEGTKISVVVNSSGRQLHFDV